MSDKKLSDVELLLAQVRTGALGLTIEPRLKGRPREVLDHWAGLTRAQVLRLNHTDVEYYFTSPSKLSEEDYEAFGIANPTSILSPSYSIRRDGGSLYYYRLHAGKIEQLVQQKSIDASVPVTIYNPKAKHALFPIVTEADLKRQGDNPRRVLDVVTIGGSYALVIRNGSEDHLDRLFKAAGLTSKEAPSVVYYRFLHGSRLGLVRDLPPLLAESIRRAHGGEIAHYDTIGDFYTDEESRAPGPKPRPPAAEGKPAKTPSAAVKTPAPSYRDEAELRALCHAYGVTLVGEQGGDGLMQYRLEMNLRPDAGTAAAFDSKLRQGSVVAGFLKQRFPSISLITQSADKIVLTMGYKNQDHAAMLDLISQEAVETRFFTLPSSLRPLPNAGPHKFLVGRAKRPAYLFPYQHEGRCHLLIALHSAELNANELRRLHERPAAILNERLNALKLVPYPVHSSAQYMPLHSAEEIAAGTSPAQYCVDLPVHPDIYAQLLAHPIAEVAPQPTPEAWTEYLRSSGKIPKVTPVQASVQSERAAIASNNPKPVDRSGNLTPDQQTEHFIMARERSVIAHIQTDEGISTRVFFTVRESRMKRFLEMAGKVRLAFETHANYGVGNGSSRLNMISAEVTDGVLAEIQRNYPHMKDIRTLKLDEILNTMQALGRTQYAREKAGTKESSVLLVPTLADMLTSGKAAIAEITLPDLKTLDTLTRNLQHLDPAFADMRQYSRTTARMTRPLKAYIAGVSELIPSLHALDECRRMVDSSRFNAKDAADAAQKAMIELENIRRWVKIYGTHLPCLVVRSTKNYTHTPEWNNLRLAIMNPQRTPEGEEDCRLGNMDASKHGMAALARDSRALLHTHTVTLSKGRAEALLLTPALAKEVHAHAAQKLGDKPMPVAATGLLKWRDLADSASRYFEPQSEHADTRSVLSILEGFGTRAVLTHERQNKTSRGLAVAEEHKGSQPALYLVVDKAHKLSALAIINRLREQGSLTGEKKYEDVETQSAYGETMVGLHQQAQLLQEASSKLHDYDAMFFGSSDRLMKFAQTVDTTRTIDIRRHPAYTTQIQIALDLIRFVKDPIDVLGTEETKEFIAEHFMPMIDKAIDAKQDAIVSVLDAIIRGTVKPNDPRLDALRHFLRYLPPLTDAIDTMHTRMDEQLDALRQRYGRNEDLDGVNATNLHLFSLANEQAVASYGPPQVTMYTGAAPRVMDCTHSTQDLRTKLDSLLETPDSQVILRCPLVPEFTKTMDSLLRSHRKTSGLQFLSQAVEQQRDGRAPLLAIETREAEDAAGDAEESPTTRRIQLRGTASKLSQLANDQRGRDPKEIVGLLAYFHEVALGEQAIPPAQERSVA